MKKLWAVLICVICLSGCLPSKSTVENAFHDEMIVIRQGDMQEFFKPHGFTAKTHENSVFYSIDYEILDVAIQDEETAVVTVDITAIDFIAAYSIEYLGLFNQHDLSYLSPIMPSSPEAISLAADMENLLESLGAVYGALPAYPGYTERLAKELLRTPSVTLNKILGGGSVPFRTSKVEVTMERTDNKWHVKMNQKLARALVGYTSDEQYDFAYNHDYKLDFAGGGNSWVMKNARRSPAADTRWKADASFYFDILLWSALIGAAVLGLYFKKKGAK